MMKRYYSEGLMSRHATDPKVFTKNRHDWKALEDKKVLVAGAGGLGSFVVAQLLGSGLKEIYVVDKDVVEVSNLNRQFWYTFKDIGKEKVMALQRSTADRPARVIPIYNRIENIDLSNYDVVLDCLDSWESKQHLMRKALEAKIPYVFMTVGEGRGAVSVPKKPLTFALRSSKKVSTPEIAVTSGFGVEQAFQILQGRRPTLQDKLLIIDVSAAEVLVLDL